MNTDFDLFATMKRFAYDYLKNPGDPLGCARRAFGDKDEQSAQYVYTQWPTNKYVLQFRKELLDEYGEEHFLPTKSDIVRELFTIGTCKAHEPEDRVKALNALANIMGFIEKPSTVVNNNNGATNNRVMVVKDHGSDFDWENKAIAQQKKLISAAKKVIKK